MKCHKGWTRNVYVIGQLVFKFPSIRNGIKAFLIGCYANWMERWYIKHNEKYNPEICELALVPPSYFCTWLGLIQIQHYCEPLGRDPTSTEILLYYKIAGGDVKSGNLGYFNRGLVCFDYGLHVNPYKIKTKTNE